MMTDLPVGVPLPPELGTAGTPRDTFIRFWGVGEDPRSRLELPIEKVSGHLTVDWVPSLPASVSSSLVGWPPHLIEPILEDESEFLAMRLEVERSDGQWKVFLSWMLGVACTRQFLESEGYLWVAPLSAFYPKPNPNATTPVDLSPNWDLLTFPSSSVVVTRKQGSLYRLRPDYIAIRPEVPQVGYEWAVVEAKGTSKRLKNCPDDWHEQVRSVDVKLDGEPLQVHRNLVVATRVDRESTNSLTRRIAVRAWNSTKDPKLSAFPAKAAVEVVAAHLFGLFRTLHLHENARALALSTQARNGGYPETKELENAADRAREELSKRVSPVSANQAEASSKETPGAFRTAIRTDLGAIEVEISAPAIALTQRLQMASSAESAQSAHREADIVLKAWFTTEMSLPREPGRVILPFGVKLLVPGTFDKIFRRGDR